ncbi:maltose alpha-D-glucosyltransferase [Fibrisoma montanum]|uniref:maltose alpha-D-glucosyltransferase n=1 Tax=Fibrisoma montanum TaxID=2305895 RepID=A0A418M6F6_9BACT|nr:maltose alpha-D-glucosyltransferase [Fibrisoma montanum]RIV21463.1 maltose alpha-D-glucosyltransferase [Fibrisoma montanum]
MAKHTAGLDDKIHWYKDAIIYELHIKAFRDGNGDGIGDFQGLLEKLDYLQELGVTAIWVLPFYPSPLKDDGYDIADYYSINPAYGNLKQFRQFLREAHNRGLKVITELVINHTSDQHPWFQRARKAPKGSPERDYYVWTDDPNQYKDVRIIFQDFEASNWTWDPVAQQYYWHRFFHHQPDLNYDNPLVQEEVFNIINYWCRMGVDGFRLDAVPYLYEREGTNGENLPETHAFLKKLRKHVDDNFPGTVFLAEANMWPEDSASYFGDGDECHMNYHFPVMPRMFMALQREDRYPITDIFDQTPPIPENCQWAMFLRNHDELTLEMVTDEERDYMYSTYAQNPKARINLGIRHRLAPLMNNDRRKIELLNSLLFSLPGTPVLYYGDEIGMGDNFYLGDRDGVRTPMQWSPDRNAGFSVTNPQRLYLPVILDPEYHYEAVNVETQRRNTSSLFWFTKRMINMRKRHLAFGRGDLKFLNVENPKVLAFTRTYQDETLLIIVNLSKYTQPTEIDMSEFKGYVPVEVFSKNRFPVVSESGAYAFTLSPYAYHWFVLDKVRLDAGEQAALPQLELTSWDALLETDTRAELENAILPDYLQKAGWFMGKGRSINNVSIADVATLSLADASTYLMLLEVSYEQGLPELYTLPLSFVQGPVAVTANESCTQAIIAQLQIGDQEGLLCDGLYFADLQRMLLQQLAASGSVDVPGGELVFSGNEGLKSFVQDRDDVKPRMASAGLDYTAIGYDNCYYLKIYRKVNRTVNPDTELSRHLSEQTDFPYVPVYVGSIDWQTEAGTITVGMIEEMVENHGDGHTYMLERMNNYIERILSVEPESRPSFPRKGTLINPVGYDELPDDLQTLLGGSTAEQVKQIGIRTGEMHLTLAAVTDKDFKPEEFSLHYQRSLYAGMQATVRESFQSQSRNLNKLPEPIRQQVEELMGRKEEILNVLKGIYTQKFDATKIRIHGQYQLNKLLLTGRDVKIRDFGGNPLQPFSERRLKRTPLRDVAAMIRSICYAAYEGVLKTNQVQQEAITPLLPYASLWAHYVAGFFTKAYFETVKDSKFIPASKDDQKVLLDTLMLEQALADLKYELDNRPEWAVVPLRIIRQIMQ